MHRDPLITIGIPVYNALASLPDCVQGTREQTDSDSDILIIADGLTDGSLEYSRSLRFERPTAVTQANRELVPTLNLMLGIRQDEVAQGRRL